MEYSKNIWIANETNEICGENNLRVTSLTGRSSKNPAHRNPARIFSLGVQSQNFEDVVDVLHCFY